MLASLRVLAAVMTAYGYSTIQPNPPARQGAGRRARIASGRPVRLRRLLPRRVRHRPLGENGRLIRGRLAFLCAAKSQSRCCFSIFRQPFYPTRPMHRCSSSVLTPSEGTPAAQRNNGFEYTANSFLLTKHSESCGMVTRRGPRRFPGAVDGNGIVTIRYHPERRNVRCVECF